MTLKPLREGQDSPFAYRDSLGSIAKHYPIMSGWGSQGDGVVRVIPRILTDPNLSDLIRVYEEARVPARKPKVRVRVPVKVAPIERKTRFPVLGLKPRAENDELETLARVFNSERNK